ncbi:MAG: DUF4101 domain-containing protein [Cyanothece sp. SIO1E1]|nr:DUF4101 domain-containing protein [Cyanothece sp. SIO1E1]
MRISLDYYRILGLPIQATADQLQQAHRDRTLQLPRREYSEAAIAARKQLIDEAYSVLSNAAERQAYDASFLAKAYDLEVELPSNGVQDAAASDVEVKAPVAATEPDSDPYTPTIEIKEDQLVGALLILLELGEYEVVIKLGRPYLSTGSVSLKDGRFGEPEVVLADIVLTVALACLELGREQWQQSKYEGASESLETGQELLLREGLFASVRGEIQADLYKLRPYRVLELLALPEEYQRERHQGLQLLRQMLQDRGGIDGTDDDLSGLSMDDFLRFIQQLRGYLTAEEQQNLFEAEARRPSAVATYLAVYALLARGFAQKQPALVQRANQMLMRLGNRQDVHLEQAVCTLLLGQTEVSSRALELSQEYEPLAFIREHSQGAPDLLPGLCLYAERWLKQEVFPHFRDLVQQQTSLKEYFADETVQTYLEALPTEADPTHQWSVGRPQMANGQGHPAATASLINKSGHFDGLTPPAVRPRADAVAAATSAAASGHIGSTNDAATMPTAERISNLSPEGGLAAADASADRSTRHSGPSTDVSTLRHAPPDPEAGKGLEVGQSRRSVSTVGTSRPPKRAPKLGRLLLLALLGFLGIFGMGFVVSRSLAWLANPLKGEQLQIQLAFPPVEIPVLTAEAEDNSATPTTSTLTKDTAEQVIRAWFQAKAEAFGPDRRFESLAAVLTGPELIKRRQQAQAAKQAGWYAEYVHNITSTTVALDTGNAEQAQIEAQVSEVTKVYARGRLDHSSADDLRVRYDLMRQNDKWQIKKVTVLR